MAPGSCQPVNRMGSGSDGDRPTLGDKISSEEMKKLLEKNGFHSETIQLNDIHYAIVAKLVKGKG